MLDGDKTFDFDAVFAPDVGQRAVFEKVVNPLLKGAPSLVVSAPSFLFR
jgi:hypothetical protein